MQERRALVVEAVQPVRLRADKVAVSVSSVTRNTRLTYQLRVASSLVLGDELPSNVVGLDLGLFSLFVVAVGLGGHCADILLVSFVLCPANQWQALSSLFGVKEALRMRSGSRVVSQSRSGTRATT